jgi:hypothetical protein
LRANQNTVSVVKQRMNAIEHDDIPAAELYEYRSPQPLAVLALVLGILSFLAVFRTLFWIVPLVAVILGATALWLLSADPEKIGRKAAICGMALALFFGAWGPSRYFSRQWWLSGQARVCADAWLELVQQKKLREAHQLHISQAQRAGERVTLDEFYRTNTYARSDYNTFFGSEPLKSFSELAGRAQIAFEQTDGYETDVNADIVTVRYRVTVDQDGRENSLPIHLVMRREPLPGTADFQWLVESVRQG